MTRLVFASVFLAYLRALPPSLAPWRDTGEMSLASWTLGVAHPTSYPLYVLLGRLVRLVPLGNFAFRLNLLSAVAGSAAVALLFSTVRRRRGTFPALAAAFLLALSAPFWTVSQVSEMYSLWILAAVALMAAALKASETNDDRPWAALAFLSGLAFANRLDLVLWAPGLLWLAAAARPSTEREDGLWAALAFGVFPAAAALSGSNLPFAALAALTLVWRSRGFDMTRRLALAAGAGAVGLSVYLYLPIRSATEPFLDWNHPAVLSNLLDSILRTRYGGTLDLISKSYATGELFGDNLRLWGAHVWDAFGPLGLAATIAGAAVGFRRDRRRWLGRAACWWWSGPVFLFLANLPPNPHAAAIIEPHYLLSDAALAFWAAEGVAAFAESIPALAPIAAAAAIAWPLWRGVPARQDRREHLATYDFAANVFRAAPPGAVVVAKKDVQLYALWHYQTVQGWRPDVKIVAQGLAGSPWYRAGWRRVDPSLPVSALNVPEGWASLSASAPAVLATQDAELPGLVGADSREIGLLAAVSGPKDMGADAAWETLVRRGARHYGETPDFFTSDLIEGEAMAGYRRGLELQREGRAADAARRLRDAWRAEWVFPEAPSFLGYMAAIKADWPEAEREFELSAALFDRKLSLASEYRALPDVTSSIRSRAADALTQWGVAAEKQGRRDEAAARYRRALATFPLAQTHYDLAVLSWNRDWAAVEANLAEAVRLDPNHVEARRYLELLRSRGVRR